MDKYRCSYKELVELHKLQPNPKNNNNHPDKQIELLAKIIDYQGQRSPIVVSNRSGFIVKGHGRLMALQKLGWDKAAVDYQDYDSEAQEYADLVADNKIAELAEFDDKKLVDDIRNMDFDLDFDLLGIPDFELPEIKVLDDENEDTIPESVETRCKPGDLWILGEHRLLCGDATNVQHVERLMNGDKADMVFTDPPYGMHLESKRSDLIRRKDGWQSKAKNYSNVIGDHEDFKPELINTIFSIQAKEYFLWGADYYMDLLPNRNNGSWIVWDKRVIESLDTMMGSMFELCWSMRKHKREIIRERWIGLHGTEQEHDHKRVHPTQKPTNLVVQIFDKWGKGLANVIDLYGGSGSTLIAAEKTNRKCYMMELDEHYCDVILKRWEEYTGKKARLESNDKTKDN